jgi:hypothetical protein
VIERRLDDVPRIEAPPYDELRRDYLLAHRPVILTNFADQWPALDKWTPELFRDRYGQREVELYDETFQQSGRNYLKSSGKTTFAEYIDRIHDGPTDVRLFLFELLDLAPELKEDIVYPYFLNPLDRLFVVTFFGGEGGVTTFHYDVDLPHVFHTVIYGTKDFYLYAPSETPYLYQHPFTVRSYVDMIEPDLQRHPRFAQARGQYCRVKRGETLAIPSGHWHQVRYTEPSWGLSLRKYEPRKIAPALYNMLIGESIDKVLTKLAPRGWWDWKERRSKRADRWQGR